MEQLEPKESQSPETEQETRTDVPEPEGMLLGDLLPEPPDDTTEPPPEPYETTEPPPEEETPPHDPPCPCPCPCPCDDE